MDCDVLEIYKNLQHHFSPCMLQSVSACFTNELTGDPSKLLVGVASGVSFCGVVSTETDNLLGDLLSSLSCASSR